MDRILVGRRRRLLSRVGRIDTNTMMFIWPGSAVNSGQGRYSSLRIGGGLLPEPIVARELVVFLHALMQCDVCSISNDNWYGSGAIQPIRSVTGNVFVENFAIRLAFHTNQVVGRSESRPKSLNDLCDEQQWCRTWMTNVWQLLKTGWP